MSKKKFFIPLLITAFLVPQITFASWWNPFSWGWFKKREVVAPLVVEQVVTPSVTVESSSSIEVVSQEKNKLTESESNKDQDNQDCILLKNDLWIGKSDKETNNEVTVLQKYLVSKNYLESSGVTGYYGNSTAEAVLRFQKDNGMDYVTLKSGVGQATRAKMGCSTTNNEPTAVIDSVSPASGPIGTQIEINGKGLSGFENDMVFIFEKSDGTKVSLYNAGGNLKTPDTRRVLTIKDQCKKGERWYNPISQSGLTQVCNSEPLTSGVYKVYSYYPKSNVVTFTITP